MANLIVGDVVEVVKPCLNNPANTRAVVVEIYQLEGRQGWSLLFRNGSHDGFSAEDLISWQVIFVRHEPTLAGYQFRSAIALATEFWAGHFAAAFPKPPAAVSHA